MNSTCSSGGAFSWNGPVCATCHTLYLGSHICGESALLKRIAELERMLADRTPMTRTAPHTFRLGTC